ncbi:HD domain-containing phosphohydrolase [Pelomonas sp. SE-A7]|uniref:HD domain-containing phosphohydrolase n=1 Tax=Pelomonas sp. SE-A7 TaxID=3054953 RepID=UPI00259CFE70|nr:HD domain-containing phosphohydrolase [Pelomonas sp. SE-A7]MDM4766538.1 HD domain-containing phosphohydrolase [Pelomonas sp. SE-A7]
MSPLRLRFADLMACLAAASELAMGQDADQALQGCAVALRIAQDRGVSGSELRQVYYQALLRFIGCNADTGVMAGIAGDVIELRRAMAPLDTAAAPQVIAALVRRIRAAHAEDSAIATALASLRGLARSAEFAREIFPGHCEVAQRLGRRLGFDERFVTGLGQLFARWDGRGIPAVAGEAILPAVRIVVLAQELLLHARLGGHARAAEVLRERRGGQFEPSLVDRVLALGPGLIEQLPARWDQLSALEPLPHEWLEGESLEQALLVLADYADIQSSWLLGHNRRVADLAVDAARSLGLDLDQQHLLRCAALVHDLGRVGISTEVWDKPGPLSQGELDRLRLHANYTRQILGRVASLAPLAELAGAAHERLDGSGYGRSIDARSLTLAARLLAAADVVAALGEARPHRNAMDLAAIAGIVGDEVAAGRLDREATSAVLAVLGARLQAPVPASRLPAGLSEREAEVLVELASGRTNKEMARRLGSSPKTIGHQVQSIYRKAGVHTRAGATLFALEQGLLPRPR